MRSPRQGLVNNPLNLFQFIHQVYFGMEAAGSIDNDDIGFTLDRGLNRIKGHGRRISAHILLDNRHFGPLSPDRKLLDGSRAKGIGCA